MFMYAVKKPAAAAAAALAVPMRTESAPPGRKADPSRVHTFGSSAASCTTGNRTRASSPWS